MSDKQIDWTEEALEGCRWIESFPCPDCGGSRVSTTVALAEIRQLLPAAPTPEDDDDL